MLSLKVCLSRGQVDLLSEYKRKMQEERQQELQAELRKQMSEASEVCNFKYISMNSICYLIYQTRDSL